MFIYVNLFHPCSKTSLIGERFLLVPAEIVKHKEKSGNDCSHAEIKKRISYHWSRHTFGTIAAANGIDILTISKLMGHRKIGTTLIYAQVLESEKRNAVEKLPMLGLQSNN